MKLHRVATLCLLGVLAACGPSGGNWHATNITGAMPPLDFTLTRASDGSVVHASDYSGKVVVLYFGYTNCPDVCPATLANLSDALHELGPRADEIRILFVSVDPKRDTPRVLNDYVRSFAPQTDGLSGTDDQLTDVTRRYRVIFGVKPVASGQAYEVMHSSAAFFFDRAGRARLVSTKTDDIGALAADLRRMLDM